MSILVVGSVALDSVETPFGKAQEVLGGSGTYFSTSASYFTDVNLVAVIGNDFPAGHLDFLRSRQVNLDGLTVADGKTFRWSGSYGYDLNEAHTLDTQLNVFASFKPQLPPHYCDAEYVFLANIDPELQLEVLQQVVRPKLVACDTMNFWIQGKKDALLRTLKYVDILLINEGEVRQLAGEPNTVKAARAVLAMGPKTLVVKQGEYGAVMFTEKGVFSAPAYPLESVYDPTGAGDTFAGGFMGYLASVRDLSEAAMRKAIVFGSVMASFNVEAFSLDRMRTLKIEEVHERYRMFQLLTEFSGID
ncbi:MAG: bifunctional hydroxymethylpyrimidine kinase/phosphomethylpyrimidine kinase [Desulfuromonadaceae bacterium]|nr:bifunctional hydroxymethylpyrimidine kinase/phosphomethylpyrimidine kinase [Desulfuromonadaceae bacterium]